MAILLVALLFSCDSFLGSLVLGFGLRSKRRRIGLAAAFGLCDALASAGSSAVGAIFRNGPGPEVVVRALVAAYVLLLAVCVRPRRINGGSPAWLLWTVPVVMSLDNLLDPSRTATSWGGVCAAVAFSAGASGLGFCLANGVRFLWQRGERKVAALSC